MSHTHEYANGTQIKILRIPEFFFAYVAISGKKNENGREEGFANAYWIALGFLFCDHFQEP